MDKEHKSEVTTEKEHRDISWLFTYRSMLNIICMATTLMVSAKAIAIQFGLIEAPPLSDSDIVCGLIAWAILFVVFFGWLFVKLHGEDKS